MFEEINKLNLKSLIEKMDDIVALENHYDREEVICQFYPNIELNSQTLQGNLY